ncbi:uncharacterized protein LOC141714911 [Apium graveolens]|uniref:uncharacterized protein LOC141714911 n=1 Tax=Apium graveolens TaxID=4045 RepID=UPI003D7AA30C
MEAYVDDMLVKLKEANDHVPHISDMFHILRDYRIKLNPLKCVFVVESKKFMGFIVNHRGIEANPTKILELKSPRRVKDVQSLTGRVAALNLFISRSSNKCQELFKVIRRAGKNFEWTKECENAFQNIKKHLGTPPMLSNPKAGEVLVLYLAVFDFYPRGSPHISYKSLALLHVVNRFDWRGSRSKGGVKYALVVMDYFMKWVEVEPLATIIAKKLSEFVHRSIMCHYGIPYKLVSDNGKQFDIKDMRVFYEQLGIQKSFSAVSHPQNNGLTEAVNKIIKHTLKAKLEEEKGTCPDELPHVLWSYNTTRRMTTGKTPFSLVYGCEAMVPLEVGAGYF